MNQLRISLIHTARELSKANIAAVESLFSRDDLDKATLLKVYKTGTVIVQKGKIIENGVINLDYAQVPLGIILQGEVIINKNHKRYQKTRAWRFCRII